MHSITLDSATPWPPASKRRIIITDQQKNNYRNVAEHLFKDVTELELHIQIELQQPVQHAEGLVHVSDHQTVRVLDVWHEKPSLSVAAVVQLARSFPTLSDTAVHSTLQTVWTCCHSEVRNHFWKHPL